MMRLDVQDIMDALAATGHPPVCPANQCSSSGTLLPISAAETIIPERERYDIIWRCERGHEYPVSLQGSPTVATLSVSIPMVTVTTFT